MNNALTAIIDTMLALDFPNVYFSLPLMSDGSLLKQHFSVQPDGGDPYLNGWLVSWKTATPRNEESIAEWGNLVAIEGWRGWAGDAGQQSMNDYLQLLLPALWHDVTLGGAAQNVVDVKLVNNEPRISFDMLCHYVRVDATAFVIF